MVNDSGGRCGGFLASGRSGRWALWVPVAFGLACFRGVYRSDLSAARAGGRIGEPVRLARAVAIAAMRSDRVSRVCCDDYARVLRLLVKRHRDMVQLRATHCVRLHAMLVELTPGGIGTTITVVEANRLLSEVEPGGEVTRCLVLIARELVADIAGLDTTPPASKNRTTRGIMRCPGPSPSEPEREPDLELRDPYRRGHPVPQPQRRPGLL